MSEPRTYRKKPVEVQAVQVDTLDYDGLCDTIRWAGATAAGDEDGHGEGVVMVIPTLEGVMAARHGDWIIRGVNGEFYPCKPDIFAKTYESVTDAHA